MSNNLQRVFLKPAEENKRNASHCVSGCIYQVVQTIGSDGKNLLQLLPIPNSSGNLIPLVQSSVMSDALKGNTGSPVHVTFQTQISSSSTSTSVQLPVFQPANSTNYFLSRTVDTSEKVRVTSVGTENFTSSVSKVQSHGVKIDGLTMQTFAVPPSSTQNDSSYILVNTQSLPMTVKSPVLPSGHHLQIPAHAEVKSVPASSLPPSVQQKILAAAATSTSGTVEASQIPTVIYVSPVKTVKNVVTKNFQNIYPKPVTEVANPVILSTTQIPVNVATEAKSGQHSQAAPVKWIFQETLQPCTPSLVPVKSSNNVASKILKTFVDRKNLGDNTVNMPPLSTISASGTQSKSIPIKDNALVMFNGKVYLLAKKGSDVLPSQIDQQNSVSPDTPPRKDTSQIVSSSPVTDISREVVNIVLAKSKSSQMETKSLSNIQLASMASLTSEKNKKVEQPSLSTLNPHNMNQSINYLKPCKTSFTNPVFPDGFSTGENTPRKGNIQSIEKISSSIDATTVTSQQGVFRDQEPKIQNEMASMLKKDTQERNDMKDTQEVGNKAVCLKNDAEFKKIFGLTKDLRVCLTRIPDHLNSGKSFDAFTSLVKGDTYKKTEVMVKKAERKQGVDKKRKPKTVKKMDYAKKRKTESACNTGVNGETSVTSSQLRSSILPTSEVSQRNSLTSHKKSREEKRTDIEHYIHDNQEKGTLSSNASFEQSHSFNKNYTEDVFPMTPPELEETIRDEKIRRLKQVLREKEAALEEIRKKMHQK